MREKQNSMKQYIHFVFLTQDGDAAITLFRTKYVCLFSVVLKLNKISFANKLMFAFM